jgi:hypothetical protein
MYASSSFLVERARLHLTYKMTIPVNTAAKYQTTASAFEASLALVLNWDGHNLGDTLFFILRDATADSQTRTPAPAHIPPAHPRPPLAEHPEDRMDGLQCVISLSYKVSSMCNW